MPTGIYKHLAGAKANNWKGGKPKCIICQIIVSNYQNKYCKKCFLKTLKGRQILWKDKISKAHIGKKKPWAAKNLKNFNMIPRTEEFKEKCRQRMTRHKVSEETRKKISEAQRGQKSHLWRGGISAENERIRKSMEYREWRKQVFERDNYTCQECSYTGNELHPHHIKSFSEYPKSRFTIDNGITLCKKCHKQTNSYGRRKSF